MPLELATTIEELDSTYPLGGDPTNKGDDHLRLIKSVMKLTFPGANGSGFDIPILATEAELNYLTGLTSNAQAQFNALGVRVDSLEASLPAPVGTKLSYYNAAPPVGWTQDTSKDGHMMRVVTGAGGGSGGTDDPTNFTHTHTTAGHVLTIAEMPAHDHAGTQPGVVNLDTPQQNFNMVNSATRTGMTGGDGSHEHGDTGSAPFTPKYIDMILASKD